MSAQIDKNFEEKIIYLNFNFCRNNKYKVLLQS